MLTTTFPRGSRTAVALPFSFDALKSDGDRAAAINEVAPPILLVRELNPDGHFVSASLIPDGCCERPT